MTKNIKSITELIVKEFEKAYQLDQIDDVEEISDIITRRTYQQLLEVRDTLPLIIKNALKGEKSDG